MYTQTKRNLGDELRDFKPSAPTEIRTLVLALKGLRPGPLDDGGNFCCMIYQRVVYIASWMDCQAKLLGFSLPKSKCQCYNPTPRRQRRLYFVERLSLIFCEVDDDERATEGCRSPD